MKKERKGFYVRVNDGEDSVVRTLKDKYAINISGAFKVFLRQYLVYLEKMKIGFEKENQND